MFTPYFNCLTTSLSSHNTVVSFKMFPSRLSRTNHTQKRMSKPQKIVRRLHQDMIRCNLWRRAQFWNTGGRSEWKVSFITSRMRVKICGAVSWSWGYSLIMGVMGICNGLGCVFYMCMKCTYCISSVDMLVKELIPTYVIMLMEALHWF